MYNKSVRFVNNEGLLGLDALMGGRVSANAVLKPSMYNESIALTNNESLDTVKLSD